MYDIERLEDEWKQFKVKRRKPYFIFTIVLVILLLVFYFFLKYTNMTISDKSNLTKKRIVHQDFQVKDKQNDKFLLAKSLLVMEENEIVVPIVVKHIKEAKVVSPIVDKVVNTPKKLKSVKKRKEIKHYKAKIKKLARKNENKVSHHKKKSKIVTKRKKVKILETSSTDAYADVENRFKRLRDPNDSLFLAKNYYRNGNYKKATHWALLTNSIDSSIEASWIIFAQSKLKLGQKNEAIQILQNYIERSDSNVAKRILYKIK